MLPHWFKVFVSKITLRDELKIFIQPRYLLLVRVKRFSKNIIVDSQLIEVDPYARGTLSSTAAPELTVDKVAYQDMWHPVISALRAVLSELRWQRAIPVIIISSHFVRYSIVTWNAELTNALEKEAYLRHCFAIAYGDASKEWDLRVSAGGIGLPSLASGISKSLLKAIQIELTRASLLTDAIHPNLMLATNETRAYLGKEKRGQSLWFVSLEPSRLCLTLIEKGKWTVIKNIAVETNINEQITALIQRESILAGIDTTNWPVIIHSFGYKVPLKISLPERIVTIIPSTPYFAAMMHTYKQAS